MKITIQSVPETLEEFAALPQNDLSKPENTCILLLLALNLYVNNNDEGIAAVNLLRGPRELSNYDKQFLRDRLRGKQYLPLAYFDGASPENNYKPSRPLSLELLPDSRPQDIESGFVRVFIKTAGADAPRPIKLRQKDGLWYLWEYSSVLSGIRIPAADDPWK